MLLQAKDTSCHKHRESLSINISSTSRNHGLGCPTTMAVIRYSALLLAATLAASSATNATNALVVVCFADPAISTKRHSVASHVKGCQITVASFRLANPADLIYVITPRDDMVDPVIQRIAARDAGWRIVAVGDGPFATDSGGSVPLRGPDGRFSGNCLRHVWYASVLRSMPDSVERVMVADGSDVFFQRDPFDLSRRYGAAELLFFGDRGDTFPEGERYFRQRLDECADDARKAPALLDAVQGAFGGVYANGGIFLGSRRAVLSLAEEVVRSAEACGYWESDQGLVNYARYLEAERRGRDKVVCFPDMAHSVSMGHYAWPSRNANDELTNAHTGEVLHIVHQYYTRQHKNNLQIYYAKVAPWLRKFR